MVDAAYNLLSYRSSIGGALRDHQENFHIYAFASLLAIPLMEINSAETFATHRTIEMSMSSAQIYKPA